MKVTEVNQKSIEISCIEIDKDKLDGENFLDLNKACLASKDIHCDAPSCLSLNICDLLDSHSTAVENPLGYNVPQTPDLIRRNEGGADINPERFKELLQGERSKPLDAYEENGIPCAKDHCLSKEDCSLEPLDQSGTNKSLQGFLPEANIGLGSSEKGDSNDLAVPYHFENVHLENCKNTVIGTKIDATGDIIIKQYVEFSGKGASPNPQIIIKDSSKREICCTKLNIISAILIVGTAMTMIVLGTYLFVFHDETNINKGDPVDEMELEEERPYGNLTITRSEWSHRRNVTLKTLPIRPARFVVVCHTASSTCIYPSTCTNAVRNIESWHVQIGLSTVWYNFLIGGDGYVYEGRGWTKEGEHSMGFNCASIGVAFIGNFDDNYLTPVMTDAFNSLIEEGVREGYLEANYTLVGHYQVKNTASPGLNVKEVIKNWPHWGQLKKEDFCN